MIHSPARLRAGLFKRPWEAAGGGPGGGGGAAGPLGEEPDVEPDWHRAHACTLRALALEPENKVAAQSLAVYEAGLLDESRGAAPQDDGASTQEEAEWWATLRADVPQPVGEVLESLRARGESPTRANTAYVADMFDAYADTFDDVLQKNLRYQVPELVRATLDELRPKQTYGSILDLGCGTGLNGPLYPEAKVLARATHTQCTTHTVHLLYTFGVLLIMCTVCGTGAGGHRHLRQDGRQGARARPGVHAAAGGRHRRAAGDATLQRWGK